VSPENFRIPTELVGIRVVKCLRQDDDPVLGEMANHSVAELLVPWVEIAEIPASLEQNCLIADASFQEVQCALSHVELRDGADAKSLQQRTFTPPDQEISTVSEMRVINEDGLADPREDLGVLPDSLA
jgi:hypothetical protein